ncbi:unnamed protein product, partial [Timema podura]|nr:unnamed protein product [Timema podura]
MASSYWVAPSLAANRESAPCRLVPSPPSNTSRSLSLHLGVLIRQLAHLYHTNRRFLGAKGNGYRPYQRAHRLNKSHLVWLTGDEEAESYTVEGSVRGKPQAASSLHTYHVFVRVATSLASKPLSYNLQANRLQYKQGLSEIREECQELVLSDGQVLEIMKRLLTELNRGLSKATHDTADVKCFTTFVQDLPNGTVCHVSWQLFDHIAECLANFMIEHDLSSERLPLGFTFSFPLSQRGLTKGYLVQWTKGFDCSDCINEDVVQMLKDAIARRNDIQLDVVALLNDAVGTLVACAVRSHNCRVGLIVVQTLFREGERRFIGREQGMDVKIDVCAILNDTTGTLMSCAWKNFNCRIGIIVG